jgi:methylamine--corrinoid protein Co-methyltransferase
MSRDQADEIVTRLVAAYGPDLHKSPIGKPFEEVYDVSSVEPTPEWAGIYDETKEFLVELGVPL